MEGSYSGDQFWEGVQGKVNFYQKYSAKVYALAYAHLKNEQISLKIVKAVFRKAFETLSAANYSEDYWALLEKYTLAAVTACTLAASAKAPGSVQEPDLEIAHAAGHGERQLIVEDLPLQAQPAGLPGKEKGPSRNAAYHPAASQRQGKGKRFLDYIALGVNIILSVVLLWLLVGLLIRLQVLPKMDLGYTWFNERFFFLF